MRARVIWKSREEGGRIAPPFGEGSPPYSTVVRFLDVNESWPHEAVWRLAVEKIESSTDGREWLADVRFLMPQAPVEALFPDRAFELYEGGKCVAVGVLLPS